MSSHGQRFEDIGLGRIIQYWPLLVLIFTVGGWYRSSQANENLSKRQADKIEELDARTTRVEDAVVNLAKIVDWQDRHRK